MKAFLDKIYRCGRKNSGNTADEERGGMGDRDKDRDRERDRQRKI